MTLRHQLQLLALFAALTAIHTWPMAMAPGTWSRVDTADYKLNTWALAWVAHQLPRDPLHLFDANIFHPEPRTLALSEHLLPQSLFSAPVLWLGGSPVLAHNVSMLAGFMLSGWAMAVVIWRWTGNAYAGVLAGSLAAFSAHTMTRLAHVQAQHTYYLPLALLALDRLLALRRVREALYTGLFVALQALTSGYWTIFMAFSVTAATVSRLGEWLPWRKTGEMREAFRPLALLLLSAGVAVILMAPFLYPYWQVQQYQGLRRSMSDVGQHSADWADYVNSGGRLHIATALKLGHKPSRGTGYLFPGVTALAFVSVALGAGVLWRDRRARMLLALGLTCFVLSFGPDTPVYRWLYEHVPPLQGLRAAVRFGGVVLLAVAGLAGFGLAWVCARMEAAAWSRRSTAALAVLAIAAANAEALRAPIHWRAYEGIPPVYDAVAALPDAVVVEIPFFAPRRRFENADYLLPATVHWKPLVNGYSGLLPLSYVRLWEAGLKRFPHAQSRDALRNVGVTHVIVHTRRLGRGAPRILAAMERSGEFEAVAGDGDVRVFRLLPKQP